MNAFAALVAVATQSPQQDASATPGSKLPLPLPRCVPAVLHQPPLLQPLSTKEMAYLDNKKTPPAEPQRAGSKRRTGQLSDSDDSVDPMGGISSSSSSDAAMASPSMAGPSAKRPRLHGPESSPAPGSDASTASSPVVTALTPATAPAAMMAAHQAAHLQQAQQQLGAPMMPAALMQPMTAATSPEVIAAIYQQQMMYQQLQLIQLQQLQQQALAHGNGAVVGTMPAANYQQQQQQPKRRASGGDGRKKRRTHTRRRGNLPKEATDLLKQWLWDHSKHPYPTEEEVRFFFFFAFCFRAVMSRC